MSSDAIAQFGDLVAFARQRSASDLHLNADVSPAIRVNGELLSIEQPATSAETLENLARAIVAPVDLRDAIRQGECSVSWNDGAGSVRVHVFRANGGLSLAGRILSKDVPQVKDLLLPEAVESLVSVSRGLILFAGPTGSGKSTTLAAFVDRINASSARRIVTVEDPIEYVYRNRRSLITQREVGPHTPSFARALHGALRCDPDVVVLGEIRDAAAIRAALVAAETGHLVLATIHVGDAAQTIDRVIDVFAGADAVQIRCQLAQTLCSVVCQHLVMRANGRSRRPVVEILIATDGVRNLIRDAKTHQLRNAIATGREHGMQTLEQHAAQLAAAGAIEDGQIYRFARSSTVPVS